MRASKIRYLLFDLNGTLVTENYLKHTEVFENILNYERRGEGLTVEKLRDVSKGKTSLKELVAKNYVVDDPEVASYRFLEVQVSQISLKKKTLDILEALHQKYTLILCSDTTGIAKEVVKKFKLSNYFDKIFYSCDVGYLKSEKTFWTTILSHFPEVKYDEFLVIGDNPRADIYHPKLLGMHTVMIENTLKQKLDYRDVATGSIYEEPEYFIKSLDELLSLLHRWSK